MEAMQEKLSIILRENKITVFEYMVATDHLVLYDEWMNIVEEKPHYLKELETDSRIYEEDRWKMLSLYKGSGKTSEEVRVIREDGSLARMQITLCELEEKYGPGKVLIGSIRDITKEKMREKQLENMVQRDTMTGLYNYAFGKQLINKYLKRQKSNESCGLLIVDIDNFKDVNDQYGHLFGDNVLIQLSGLFQKLFRKSDVLMRSGGDEFVILLKESNLVEIEKKAKDLLQAVQALSFEENGYSMKCSIGICYSQAGKEENSYDKLFRMADEALYLAKKNGRNQYQCCVI